MSLSKSHSVSNTKPRPGRRGGFGIEPLRDHERRRHIVKALFNDDELELLNMYRGEVKRSEYLRSASIGKLRPQPPAAINCEAWLTLSKAAGNLATLAVAARAGAYIEDEKILDGIRAFRNSLFTDFGNEPEGN
jgi:hypothetical protein